MQSWCAGVGLVAGWPVQISPAVCLAVSKANKARLAQWAADAHSLLDEAAEGLTYTARASETGRPRAVAPASESERATYQFRRRDAAQGACQPAHDADVWPALS